MRHSFSCLCCETCWIPHGDSLVRGSDGKPTYVPKYNEIRHNLWINNYNPQEAVDNDDGSAYYESHQ